MFLVGILNYYFNLIQVLNAHAWMRFLPTINYGTVSPLDKSVHGQLFCGQSDHFRLHSWAGNADKCSVTECSKERKKKLCWTSGIRNREGRGWGFQMGHAEGVDFQVSPAGHVWPNRKWRGFWGAWHWTHKPGFSVPLPSKLRHSSHSQWSSSQGTSVGTSGNVALMRSVSCLRFHACRSRPGA